VILLSVVTDEDEDKPKPPLKEQNQVTPTLSVVIVRFVNHVLHEAFNASEIGSIGSHHPAINLTVMLFVTSHYSLLEPPNQQHKPHRPHQSYQPPMMLPQCTTNHG
jgi:hypothetical protein